MSKLYPISTMIIYSLMLINYLCAMGNNGNNSNAMICCSAFSNWPLFGGVGPVCNPNC